MNGKWRAKHSSLTFYCSLFSFFALHSPPSMPYAFLDALHTIRFTPSPPSTYPSPIFTFLSSLLIYESSSFSVHSSRTPYFTLHALLFTLHFPRYALHSSLFLTFRASPFTLNCSLDMSLSTFPSLFSLPYIFALWTFVPFTTHSPLFTLHPSLFTLDSR